MDKPNSTEALNRAISQFPTLRAFAEAMHVHYQVVQQWRLNGVPAEYCPEVEKLTGVTCEELNEKVDWAYVRSTSPQADHPHQNRSHPDEEKIRETEKPGFRQDPKKPTASGGDHTKEAA